jgi:hypothetical protein
MNEPRAAGTVDQAAVVFEELRPRLVGVAYGLLGTITEPEDVVQEAWIRPQCADLDVIDGLAGWLVTTVSWVALDVLRSAHVRREAYTGPWLPEPVETMPDPADAVSLANSLSWAMLVVLDTSRVGPRRPASGGRAQSGQGLGQQDLRVCIAASLAHVGEVGLVRLHARGGRRVVPVLPGGHAAAVAVPRVRSHRLGGEHRPGRVATGAPERHRDPRDEISAALGFAGRTGADPAPAHPAASCHGWNLPLTAIDPGTSRR